MIKSVDESINLVTTDVSDRKAKINIQKVTTVKPVQETTEVGVKRSI